MAKKYLDDTGMSYFWGKLKDYFQVKLVSGTNIKTINNETLLGSGDISVTTEDTSGVLTLGTKYGGTIKYIKTNGVVSVYLANGQLSGMTANADNNWDTPLPSGFRPLSEPLTRLYNDNGYAYVTASGTVRVHPTAASAWIGFCITYVATQ